MDQLKETIASTSRGTSSSRSTGTITSIAESVTISVSGCGYDDRETFEVADERTARAAMRKFMATGVRLFGRADSNDE